MDVQRILKFYLILLMTYSSAVYVCLNVIPPYISTLLALCFLPVSRAVTRALIGGVNIHIFALIVLPDESLLKSTLMTTDFKRNSSGRTRIYEYSPPQLTL